MTLLSIASAYADKGSVSYWAISKILNAENKFIRKLLTRRLKRRLAKYTKSVRTNLGFHPILKEHQASIECFTSDINTSAIYFGINNKHLFDFYKQHLTDNSIFLDIGANVGIHTLAAHSANQSVDIHAFEPSPDIHSRLKRNISENKTTRIYLHQLALSNTVGELYFNDKSADANIGTSQISLTPTELKVKVSTVDTLFAKEPKRVSLIKIDVEGFEPGVLEGAREVLTKDTPAIILEFNRHHYGIEEIVQHIPYDFCLYTVEKSRLSLVSNVNSLNNIHRAKDILITPI